MAVKGIKIKTENQRMNRQQWRWERNGGVNDNDGALRKKINQGGESVGGVDDGGGKASDEWCRQVDDWTVVRDEWCLGVDQLMIWFVEGKL